MDKSSLYVGAATVPINFLKSDFPLKDYTSELDKLNIRVILIQNVRTIALIQLEITSLAQREIIYLKNVVKKKTGVADENIWISVSHTFSAPHFPSETNSTLYSVLVTRITEALDSALTLAETQMTQVNIFNNKTICGINVNRNVKTELGWWLGADFEGYSNKVVDIIEFIDLDNNLVALIYNYDIQPSVLADSVNDDGYKAISGDLIGKTSRLIEEKYNNQVTAIFALGAAGDQSPILKAKNWEVSSDDQLIFSDLGVKAHPIVDLLGNSLAKSILDCCRYKKKQKVCNDIDTAMLTIRCPKQRMKYPTKEIKPQKKYHFEMDTGEVSIELYGIRLGNIIIIGLQPEINSKFGQEIKSLVEDDQIFVWTMINGAAKYLPETLDYQRVTYTSMNTILAQTSSDIVLEGIKSLITTLKIKAQHEK